MSNDERALVALFSRDEHNPQEEEEIEIRDIHALTPPRPTQPTTGRSSGSHHSRRSSSLSMTSDGGSSENFTTMSREFNALVLAGSTIRHSSGGENGGAANLGRIGEEEMMEESNPLAIVPDNNPILGNSLNSSARNGSNTGISVQSVKKEEVDSKIGAWENAKIAKINNRFKREEAIISGWESEQVQKASSWMKKVERKLEAKRARALEKMQNDVAKAQRKAEEKRASAEANRGTKVAKILEVANLMRAIGRAPSKRKFF